MSRAKRPWPAHLSAYFAPAAQQARLGLSEAEATRQRGALAPATSPLSARTDAPADAAPSDAGEVAEAVVALLIFRVGGELHGLDLQRVGEVAKLAQLTCVPRLQRGVMGIVSLRGKLVPVVDLAQHFGLQAPAVGEAVPRHVVVVGGEHAPLGLGVGTVVGVHRLPASAISRRGAHRGHESLGVADRGDDGCVTAFATTAQGETVVVLDVAALEAKFAVL